jgi:putative hydroxymethylpyrimidine transport system substrate-binding protein
VKERNVGFNLAGALLSRKVDATLGGFFNYEGVDLRLRRKDPRVTPVDRAGVPPYDELVIVANEDGLPESEQRVRRFLAALERGTRDLRRDPRGALRGLLEDNRDLSPRLQRAVLDVTLPFFLPPRGKPYGWHEPAEWRRFAAWMRDNRLLTGEPDEGVGFTNELLPGQGP